MSSLHGLLLALSVGAWIALRVQRARLAYRCLKELERRHAAEADELIRRATQAPSPIERGSNNATFVCDSLYITRVAPYGH